jgi:ligand-binding sensor domain-containing protein
MKVMKIINSILFLSILTTFVSCNGQGQKTPDPKKNQQPAIGHTVSAIGKKTDCIFQDRNNNYWFASNGEGAFRYDGKTITQITTKDGLCSDFVWSITEDKQGNLWFTTRDGFCCYNGTSFINYTATIKNAPYGKFQYSKDGLFFGHLNGVCYYDGTSFTNFVIHPDNYKPPTHTMYRPYEVYCTLVDHSGKVWFGTQEKGVCIYDGKTFSFITGKDLDGPAVRSIFQDKKGNLWFGNNGGGLYQYNGTALRNITEENKLSNDEFLKERMPVDKPGSLARVFAINDDEDGNIWIGTVDAGVWKYDGVKLTNYTTKDGLSTNSVYGIYKDKKGKLWFISNGETIFNFDGQKFVKAAF